MPKLVAQALTQLPLHNMKKLLSSISICLLLFITFASGIKVAKATTCTPHTDYLYCRPITVNAGQVPSAQTDFTWLICANSTLGNGNACQTVPGLNQTGAGAHVTNSNGYDIVLTSDSSGTTLMNWETEKYVASTGEFIAWGKSASISDGTVVYVSYGNALISSFQGGSTGTNFDSATKVAYHMADTGSTLADSSPAGNNATKKSSTEPNPTTSGFIGSAQDFVGVANTSTNDYATFPASMPNSNTWTIEWWGKQIADPPHTGGLEAVFLQRTSQNVGAGYFWFTNGTLHWRDDFNSSQTPTASGQASGGAWYHVAFVRNGDSMNIYLNGVAGTAKTGFGTSAQSFLALGFSGAATSIWSSFNGTLDEVKVSNNVRSADWLTTEYNEGAPATFETWGSEQSGSVDIIFFFFNSIGFI